MPVPRRRVYDWSFCCYGEMAVSGVECVAVSCAAGPRGQFCGLGKEVLCSESTGFSLLWILYLVPSERGRLGLTAT